jgi:hypothetical protein
LVCFARTNGDRGTNNRQCRTALDGAIASSEYALSTSFNRFVKKKLR